MTAFDSQALIALLVDEPGGAEVAELMSDRDSIPLTPALALAETLDILVRRMGNRVEATEEQLGWLRAGGLEIVPVTEEIARMAGILRARHWHGSRCPVSLADCVLLATGMIEHEPIATADAALIAAARAEGHPVIVLPDSHGNRAP